MCTSRWANDDIYHNNYSLVLLVLMCLCVWLSFSCEFGSYQLEFLKYVTGCNTYQSRDHVQSIHGHPGPTRAWIRAHTLTTGCSFSKQSSGETDGSGDSE